MAAVTNHLDEYEVLTPPSLRVYTGRNLLGSSPAMAHDEGKGNPAERRYRPPSLRRRAFTAFDRGESPEAVARTFSAKLPTIERYHRLWRHRPLAIRVRYRLAQAIRKRWPAAKTQVAAQVAEELHISQGEARAHLERPWAWHQLLTGRWRSRQSRTKLP